MKNINKMNSIDYVAFAGLLHDVGKFGQRANIDIKKESIDFQMYCPQKFDGGYWTHQHSAFTVDFLKSIVGKQREYSEVEIVPEIDGEGFESLSSKHHKPVTSKQWIVAMADRIASGFERDKFEEYNNADDRAERKEKYYETPLDNIFDENKIFELSTLNSNNINPADKRESLTREEYSNLYSDFLKDVDLLFKTSNDNIMDGMDFLLKKFTSFIPSSTYKTKANIPLYDHLKTTSAFASALAKYHENDMDIKKIKNYDTEKFLLIAGDFFGIQNFIFSNVPTAKASKILRGKSAYIQIFTKTIARDICKKLEISTLSIVSDNAGKFEILAPNSDEVLGKLEEIQKELNEWFLRETFGESGVGLSYVKACAKDFVVKNRDEKGNFQKLRDKLAKEIEITKLQKFDLINQEPVFDILTKDNAHLCKICGKRFINDKKKDDHCDYCDTFIKIGEELAKSNFIQIFDGDKTGIEIFGAYKIKFYNKLENIKEIENSIIFDIQNDELFRGYSKWALKSYVQTIGEGNNKKVLDFEKLAKQSCGAGKIGVKALMSLKGDVDNMGKFLTGKIGNTQKKRIDSFAKFNFVSRLIDYFFSVKVSEMMEENNLYTIFAGGDDLFVIGAWDEVIEFAKEVRTEFMKFVAGSDLTFSVGMEMFKSSKPINYVAEVSEEALEDAKNYKEEQEGSQKEKNAITLYGYTVGFEEYIVDMLPDFEVIKRMAEKYPDEFNTAFWYRFLEFCDMKENIETDIKNALWKSKVSYMFKRNIIDKHRDEDFTEVIKQINENIETYGASFKMVIFEQIYKNRRV